jgi:hypothetical protein
MLSTETTLSRSLDNRRSSRYLDRMETQPDHPLADEARRAVEQLDEVLRSAIAEDRPIDALATIRATGDVLAPRSREAAAAATEAGSSWADVGQALGISRQAAHQRLGSKVIAQRQRIEEAERTGHERITAKFAKARTRLDRRAADPEHLAAARAQVDASERETHERLARKMRSAHEHLDRQERKRQDRDP